MRTPQELLERADEILRVTSNRNVTDSRTYRNNAAWAEAHISLALAQLDMEAASADSDLQL